jgi:cell wall-active antibiotic response 4TMS protein YvqF
MRTSTAPHLLSPRLRGPGRAPDLGRLLLGLTVVALGVLFLLDSAGVLNAGRAIDRWWPLLLVAAGVLTLAERPPSVVRGTVLTVGGAILLLFTTDLVEGNGWDYVWPAALIAAGIAIVAR